LNTWFGLIVLITTSFLAKLVIPHKKIARSSTQKAPVFFVKKDVLSQVDQPSMLPSGFLKFREPTIIIGEESSLGENDQTAKPRSIKEVFSIYGTKDT
jgi:hypothetical protein